MSVQSVNYQCPACGGPFGFDAETGKLKCEYCDSVFTPEEIEALYAAKQEKAEDKAAAVEQPPAQEDRTAQANAATAADAAVKDADPIEAYLSGKKTMEEAEGDVHCCQCSSCGAQLIVTEVTAVTQCPYCGNNTVIPGKLGKTLEPDYVIPFATTKEQAVQALTNHYGGKVLLPKEFKDQNHIEEVQGVYVPFWLFDGEADGDARFVGTNTRTWSDRDWIYTETSTYEADRSGHASFKMVPVDGSKRMPDDHMDSIEPFDYNKMKPYSVAYLPGFLADRYDETVKECSGRARGRIATALDDALRKTVTGYDTVSVQSGVTEDDVDFDKVSYALLPVWMLHTKWNGQDFLFAMNGQTGKLVGDLPMDKGKLRLISLASFAATFVVAAAVALLVL